MKVRCIVLAALVMACGGDSGDDVCSTCAEGAICRAGAADPCSCPAGHTGDGRLGGSGCTAGSMPVNECADDTDDCVAGATCVDTADRFTCTCAAGFSGDGTASGSGCTDIDECALGTDDCGALDCVNAVGRFTCFAWLTPGPFENFLDRRSASFLLLDRLEVTSPAGEVAGVNSMARDPTTGTIHVIIKVTGKTGRVLATLDPATAVATEIGNLEDSFATLAFDATGQLWGVTGDGAMVPETLYRIDKSSGAPTLARALGIGTDGECVAYHPTANLLYHWSGSPVTAETIDISSPTLELTPITVSGTPEEEVLGCLFDATLDAFLIWDRGSTVRTMTGAGAFSGVLFGTARVVRTSLYVATSGHTVTPASGPLAGGTAITLTGLGLDLHGPAPTVTVDGVAATDVHVADSTMIQAVTPTGAAAGPVDVVLSGTGPEAYTWPAGFTYDSPLAGAARAEPPGPHRQAVPAKLPARSSSARWKAPAP